MGISKVIHGHCGAKDKPTAQESHTGVSVLREKFRAADTAQQSLFIAHIPYLHVQSGHNRQL